jgi:hypothetical protein
MEWEMLSRSLNGGSLNTAFYYSQLLHVASLSPVKLFFSSTVNQRPRLHWILHSHSQLHGPRKRGTCILTLPSTVPSADLPHLAKSAQEIHAEISILI